MSNIENSSGGKVNSIQIHIHKLEISGGEAVYTPSIKQRILRGLGVRDYQKDIDRFLKQSKLIADEELKEVESEL